MGSFGYPVEEVAREVLKLAPYTSEDVIKILIVDNRYSMSSFGIHQPKKVDLERKIKKIAEKNASKCGFLIPSTDKITNSRYEKLMRYELWNLKEMHKIDFKLKEFFNENKIEYFSAKAGNRPLK